MLDPAVVIVMGQGKPRATNAWEVIMFYVRETFVMVGILVMGCAEQKQQAPRLTESQQVSAVTLIEPKADDKKLQKNARSHSVRVSNGDSKPPEMATQTVRTCAETQVTRCVSCCEDYFSYGSDHWNQCINSCPQIGVEALLTEY